MSQDKQEKLDADTITETCREALRALRKLGDDFFDPKETSRSRLLGFMLALALLNNRLRAQLTENERYLFEVSMAESVIEEICQSMNIDMDE